MRFRTTVVFQIEVFSLKNAHWALLMNLNFNFKNCLPPWTCTFYSVLLALHSVPLPSQRRLLFGMPPSYLLISMAFG